MPNPVKDRNFHSYHLLAGHPLHIECPVCKKSDTLAVTGTSRGMTPGQKDEMEIVLTELLLGGYRRLRHGDCIGADAQIARIAKNVGFYLIAHPGHPKDDPNETKYRAFTDFNDEVMPSEPFLVRDKKMVEQAARLIAAPYQDYEVQRSGTWTTVRYAGKFECPVTFVYPNRNRLKGL